MGRSTGFAQLRQDDLRQRIEGVAITKERRLIRCHRFDDLTAQRIVRPRLQTGHQRTDVGETGLPDQRHEPTLDQILLAGAEHNRGLLLDQVSDKSKRARRDAHSVPPYRGPLEAAIDAGMTACGAEARMTRGAPVRRPAPTAAFSVSAIRLSGTTSSARPAATIAPGMPHTTEVASSWTTMCPPAA